MRRKLAADHAAVVAGAPRRGRADAAAGVPVVQGPADAVVPERAGSAIRNAERDDDGASSG